MQKVYRLISVAVSVFLCFFLVVWIALPVSAAAGPVSASADPLSSAVEPAADSAGPASINDLISHSSEYDNQTVTLTGEVIGERMIRGDYCWINMSDGTNAIGIWITKTDADRIGIYGDYKHTGDTITVTGVYYESCREHGGEPDVHCISLAVANTGAARSESISVEKILSAVGVVSAALILFIIYTTKNRNSSH